jgi:hypothetical protein
MPQSNRAATLHCVGSDDLDVHQRESLTYRFATRADFAVFYGKPQRMTARAVVILLNDKPAAMIGLAYGLDCATMFSDAKPELQPHIRRMPVLRAIKLAMTMADTCGRDVYAIREEGTNILPRLGFEHYDGETYKWQSSRQRSLT